MSSPSSRIRGDSSGGPRPIGHWGLDGRRVKREMFHCRFVPHVTPDWSGRHALQTVAEAGALAPVGCGGARTSSLAWTHRSRTGPSRHSVRWSTRSERDSTDFLDPKTGRPGPHSASDSRALRVSTPTNRSSTSTELNVGAGRTLPTTSGDRCCTRPLWSSAVRRSSRRRLQPEEGTPGARFRATTHRSLGPLRDRTTTNHVAFDAAARCGCLLGETTDQAEIYLVIARPTRTSPQPNRTMKPRAMI